MRIFTRGQIEAAAYLFLIFISLDGNLGANQPPLAAPLPIAIAIERADSADEQQWGVMGRKALSKNWGMLFHYPAPRQISLWSFNCHVDLDIAFLDEHGRIQEIGQLKAYPEMMDPQRPVNHLNDLHLYRHSDPIVEFYLHHRLNSQKSASYALECLAGYFEEHDLGLGDLLVTLDSDHGIWLRPLSIDAILEIWGDSRRVAVQPPTSIALEGDGQADRYAIEFYGLEKQQPIDQIIKQISAQKFLVYSRIPVHAFRIIRRKNAL